MTHQLEVAAHAVACAAVELSDVAAHGLLVGFTPAVWLVTALTACGGLLVAAVVKHADNLLKTYSTAVAILVTCLFTTATTGVAPSACFLQGMALVLSSLLFYNGAPAGPAAARGLLRRARAARLSLGL